MKQKEKGAHSRDEVVQWEQRCGAWHWRKQHELGKEQVQQQQMAAAHHVWVGSKALAAFKAVGCMERPARGLDCGFDLVSKTGEDERPVSMLHSTCCDGW